MDTEEIAAFARQLGGGEIPETVLDALCKTAAAQLLARLREDVDTETIRAEFVMAAGMLALSMYIAASGSGEVTAFKAGNLSVEMAGGETRADTLRRQAELLLGSYIADQGFAFRCIDSGGDRSCRSRGRKGKNGALCPGEDGNGESAEDAGDADNE